MDSEVRTPGSLPSSQHGTTLSQEQVLAVLCRFLQLGLRHYDGGLTAETLAVLLILAMDRAGHAPSVSELAELVGVPKSNMSRYVANQINAGHLEEVIVPTDRRRRLLRPSDAGRKEFTWIMGEISEIASAIGQDDKDLITVLTAVRPERP